MKIDIFEVYAVAEEESPAQYVVLTYLVEDDSSSIAIEYFIIGDKDEQLVVAPLRINYDNSFVEFFKEGYKAARENAMEMVKGRLHNDFETPVEVDLIDQAHMALLYAYIRNPKSLRWLHDTTVSTALRQFLGTMKSAYDQGQLEVDVR